MQVRNFVRLLAAVFASLAGAASALAHDLPANCGDTFPAPDADCIYAPDTALGNIQTFTMTLRDATRNNYPVPIRVRYSGDATGVRPVVILNHGGGTSATGRNSMPEWSTLFAEAGYIVIHPSRVKPASLTGGQIRMCKRYGGLKRAIPRICKGFLAYQLYGPLNTDFLIDNFAAIQARMVTVDPSMLGLIDSTLSKVIVGGWSGGSTIPVANAGAWRRYADNLDKVDFQGSTRPVGFFGFSTMGPDYAGFDGGLQSGSYSDIDERPFLTITGKGDKKGKTSEARTTAFIMAEPGEKYLSWSVAAGIGHSHMAHIASTCSASAAGVAHCLAFESPMLAFLDFVALGDAEAEDWLKSDAYRFLTGNAVELQRR
jgi:hypothetical protein